MAIGAKTITPNPDYMTVPVTDGDHPIHKGSYSPDLLHDTGRAQMAATVNGPPDITGADNTPVNEAIVMTMKQADKADAIDPLTGLAETVAANSGRNANGNDVFHLLMMNTSLLNSLLVEMKASRPQSKCRLIADGPSSITNVQASNFKFQISGKNVPALQMDIQNNTAATIYIGLDESATPGGIQIPAGGRYQTIAKISNLSILNSVAGPSVVNGQTTLGVKVYAWSNPEYTKMRGNI